MKKINICGSLVSRSFLLLSFLSFFAFAMTQVCHAKSVYDVTHNEGDSVTLRYGESKTINFDVSRISEPVLTTNFEANYLGTRYVDVTRDVGTCVDGMEMGGGVGLAAETSCTITTKITAGNTTGRDFITPRVCGFGGNLCSQLRWELGVNVEPWPPTPPGPTPGDAVCWGANDYGSLGIGTVCEYLSTTPVAVVGIQSEATVAAAGNNFACALVDGGVKCWGNNYYGQLGDGSVYISTSPVDVFGLSSGSGATAIAVGDHHTCAVVNGGVKCWGRNYYGQLGDGTSDFLPHPFPVDVVGLGSGSGATAVAAGDIHTCAVVNGGVKCWGYNNRGQLGDGTTDQRVTPVDVVGLGSGSGATAVAAGDTHTCAVVNGGVKCWGHNQYGQLGDGRKDSRPCPLPVDVVGLGSGSGVTAIAAGRYHTCAVVNGVVKCWGGNSNGQLGDGTMDQRTADIYFFHFSTFLYCLIF